MHVFDTARGIASVFQQRAAHCTFFCLDSSDSSKDEPPAICGQVERSKQFKIRDGLGVVFTAQLFVFFVFLLPLVEAFQLDEGRNPHLLIWLPCHCCFLRRSLFRHLDFPNVFPSVPSPRKESSRRRQERRKKRPRSTWSLRQRSSSSPRCWPRSRRRPRCARQTRVAMQAWSCARCRLNVASRITTDTL